jgi:predicted AAA+ superfamily ATPase
MFAKRFSKEVHFFDLEDPADMARIDEPMLALPDLRGLVVIDEVQLRPDLFPAIRVLADRKPRRTRFLLLGSASPDLVQRSSETIAGRVSYYELPGFSVEEVGITHFKRLWLRGSFPRSYLATSNSDSLYWRNDFIRTFLERDIPQLGIRISGGNLRRFWYMLAHSHGQISNLSQLASSFGVSQPTIRNYLHILAGTFVVTILPPWHENIRKRQVKSPKLYISDCGILHALLDLKDIRDVERHPVLGASWEGFVISTIIQRIGDHQEQCYFWATHQGAELDLLVVQGSKRFGFEIKRTVTPKKTKSMLIAMDTLGLDGLDVIHAGKSTYQLDSRIRAVAFSDLLSLVQTQPLKKRS